jgi:hypothetical protein
MMPGLDKIVDGGWVVGGVGGDDDATTRCSCAADTVLDTPALKPDIRLILTISAGVYLSSIGTSSPFGCILL